MIRKDGTLKRTVVRRHSDGEEVVTRREAAELAGVHYNTIRSWEKEGLLNVTRIGSRVWIRLDELLGVIAGRGPKERKL